MEEIPEQPRKETRVQESGSSVTGSVAYSGYCGACTTLWIRERLTEGGTRIVHAEI